MRGLLGVSGGGRGVEVPLRRHLRFCIERAEMLLSHGVKPMLIFDGGLLPAKAATEAERHKCVRW